MAGQDVNTYLAEIELALIASPVLSSYQIVRSWANTDDGYIRIRATLRNSDFLEAAEYFVLEAGKIVTVDYRHQWMDPAKLVLHRRWDNTPDHLNLANAPHHIHLGSEDNVIPGAAMSVLAVLTILDQELSAR